MNKILLIDRDGTLIEEPPVTQQVNTLEELIFLPQVIGSLKQFVEAGFELYIVTNQDGLGTASNTRENYDKINAKMLEVFAGEGIIFKDIFECPHSPVDNCACRKPKVGILGDFKSVIEANKDTCFMVGDRATDIEFANNLGITGLKLEAGIDWEKITQDILFPVRASQIKRKTKETEIDCYLNLDAKPPKSPFSGGLDEKIIDTGLSFLDHMLEQLQKHGDFGLKIICKGDLEVDEHHTVEDTGIALGEAFREALGDKRGITRYAWERILVMDEAKTEVSLDLSGRAYCVFEADFGREYVGDLPTEMVEHFFQSFCLASGLNLHITITGKNTHHQIEACFKAFARCLKEAVKREGFDIVSTKGLLQ